jgi:hypothetical protein
MLLLLYDFIKIIDLSFRKRDGVICFSEAKEESRDMFQKIAPLIVLAMFAVGAYFMLQGMHNATNMAQSRPEVKK